MYRQKRRGSPTRKSPAALCWTEALSHITTSWSRHECAYCGACASAWSCRNRRSARPSSAGTPSTCGRPVEIEVQRGLTRDGMGAHDGMRHLDECFERPFRARPRREHAAVVVAIRRAQAPQARLQARFEHSTGGPHVEEAGVAARPRRELARVEHGRGGGTLRVRVVGVEHLEQAGPETVAAEVHVAQQFRSSSVSTKPASMIWRSSP